MSRESVDAAITLFGRQRFHEMINEGYTSDAYHALDKKAKESYVWATPEEFKEKTGLEFRMLSEERESEAEYCEYVWRWQVGDEVFEHRGHYSSWDGIDFPSFDSYIQVKKIQMVSDVWIDFDTKEPIQGQFLDGKVH